MKARFYDPRNITIGEDTIVGEGAVLDGRAELFIGSHVDNASDTLVQQIVIGPGGASPRSGQRDTGSFANYLRKGMIPITKYGLCPVPTSTSVADHFVLFVQNGGAQEFPPSQIVAYAWHKRNPFTKLGVRFTQVDPIRSQLKSFTCDFCGYSLDFMPNDPSAGTAYRQHLMNSDKIPFREAIESVKAAGLTVTPFRPRAVDEIMELVAP